MKDSRICLELANVHLNIDKSVKKLQNESNKLSHYKMYLLNILKDDDVYDTIHTNIKGSKKIAEYIGSTF